ncbi:hypothetical protein [Rubrolithibacter danxiaensis]|uniref:hypothetical protein n=1 Tax=Rubrolithibacter danxiaensis TaxID=3390805 RepID=UPI003BF7EC4C
MKAIKKYSRSIFSLLLLICFSAGVIPLDFYHNHTFQPVSCQDTLKTGTCKHKLHLTEKASSCWVCAVHFDKTFVNASFKHSAQLHTVVSHYIQKEVSNHFIELIFSSLRGPPLT